MYKPILLLSLPRSGSNWAAAILSRCQGVRYIAEPADAYVWPMALWAKLGMADYPTPTEANANSRFKMLWKNVLCTPDYFEQSRTSTRFLSRVPPGLIRQLVKHRSWTANHTFFYENDHPLCRQTTHHRLLIKDVTISFCSGLVADWLNADVLVLRRDPMKVVASWRKIGFPPEDVHLQQWVNKKLLQNLSISVPDLPTSAERLAWTVGLQDLALMREAEIRRWPVITHEQLVESPKENFQKIATYFDLVSTEDMWEFISKSETSSGDRFSTNRTSEQIKNSSDGIFNPLEQYAIHKVLEQLSPHLPEKKNILSVSRKKGQ